jgi:hypothetical protein
MQFLIGRRIVLPKATLTTKKKRSINNKRRWKRTPAEKRQAFNEKSHAAFKARGRKNLTEGKHFTNTNINLIFLSRKRSQARGKEAPIHCRSSIVAKLHRIG